MGLLLEPEPNDDGAETGSGPGLGIIIISDDYHIILPPTPTGQQD